MKRNRMFTFIIRKNIKRESQDKSAHKPISNCAYTSKMLAGLIIVALLITKGADASSKKMERMTISEMRMTKNDLDSAGSGYAYNQQQNREPISYVHYTNHGIGHYYDAPMRYYVSVNGIPPSTIPKLKYNPVEIQAKPLVYSLTNEITNNRRPLAPYFLSRKWFH